jgi:hypothetical protein
MPLVQAEGAHDLHYRAVKIVDPWPSAAAKDDNLSTDDQRQRRWYHTLIGAQAIPRRRSP